MRGHPLSPPGDGLVTGTDAFRSGALMHHEHGGIKLALQSCKVANWAASEARLSTDPGSPSSTRHAVTQASPKVGSWARQDASG